MISLAACGTGFVLDFLFGDPVFLYHPVRLMGAFIALLERGARSICRGNEKALLAAGVFLWVLAAGGSAAVVCLLLYEAQLIHPAFRFVLESFWCYQLLAAKSLKQESMKVYIELERGNLEGARKSVSMIVGRDTQSLDEAGVIRAAVETVAENTSDGVTAPLLFMVIGGAPLGFLYKAANTMDSMLGYRDERYLYLGRCPAKLDDVLNYIPSRLSAVLMIATAWLLGMDSHNAVRIYKRDRRKHASPNSAQTEAVCAGALQIRLAGDASYFGKLYKKETIGDDIRSVKSEDIVSANRLMYGTAILAFLILASVRVILWVL